MKIFKTIGVVVATVFLNYLTYRLVVWLNIPLFLDTWATGLATMIGGVVAGLFGGALYNILLAILAGKWAVALWGLSSLFVAFAVWLFNKFGWLNIKKPWLVLVAGLLTGFGNAIVSSLISIIFFDGFSTYKPTEGIYLYFFRMTDSTLATTLFHQFSMELIDKTLVFFLIAILFYFVGTKVKWMRKNKKIGG